MTNSCILLSSVLCYTFLLLITNLSTTIVPIDASVNGTHKIVLPLLHRDSCLLLLRNPKNRLRLERDTDVITAPLVPDPFVTCLFVNISIGQPPVSVLLGVDTGSPLTWVQGAPTSNYNLDASSTYIGITCSYRYECFEYLNDFTETCSDESHCTYTVQYLDNSHTSGMIALEKFTFSSSTDGIAPIRHLIFGYSLETFDESGLSPHGLLGLHPLNEYSLVSRIGNKFSYCVGNISDPDYMYSRLVVGDGAVIQGDSTPMQRAMDGYYMVKLEGISIGDTQLEIHPLEFHHNVAIDSGSTFTYLTRNAFGQLKGQVTKLLHGFLNPVVDENAGERPCYRGDLRRDLEGFPMVSLKLSGGVEIDLDVEGLFRREGDGVFCMAVDVTDHEPYIIGMYAQQNYNVAFDYDAMQISFDRIDCQMILED